MTKAVDGDAAAVVVVAVVGHDAFVGHLVPAYLRFAAELTDQLVECVLQ